MLTSVRIENAVQRAGGTVRIVQTDGELFDTLRHAPAFAVVDLGLPWLNVDIVAEWCQDAGVPLVAFGPHVDVGGLRRARNAGVEFVYPRSKFLADLNGVVAEVLNAGQASPTR